MGKKITCEFWVSLTNDSDGEGLTQMGMVPSQLCKISQYKIPLGKPKPNLGCVRSHSSLGYWCDRSGFGIFQAHIEAKSVFLCGGSWLQ